MSHLLLQHQLRTSIITDSRKQMRKSFCCLSNNLLKEYWSAELQPLRCTQSLREKHKLGGVEVRRLLSQRHPPRLRPFNVDEHSSELFQCARHQDVRAAASRVSANCLWWNHIICAPGDVWVSGLGISSLLSADRWDKERMKTDLFSSIRASAGGWTLMETFPGRLRSVVHPGGAHDFHTMSQMFSCWQTQLHNIHPSSPATRVLLTPSATSPPVMGDSSPAFPESLEIPWSILSTSNGFHLN